MSWTHVLCGPLPEEKSKLAESTPTAHFECNAFCCDLQREIVRDIKEKLAEVAPRSPPASSWPRLAPARERREYELPDGAAIRVGGGCRFGVAELLFDMEHPHAEQLGWESSKLVARGEEFFFPSFLSCLPC